jgi:hypothetical protein
MALDDQNLPEPCPPKLSPPGSLVEPQASPNTQIDGPPKAPAADLAALADGLGADHPFTLDGPATRIGRKRKARDLHAILEVCVCGQAVTDGEASSGEGVIRCRSVGCETGWVSAVTAFL